MHNPMQFIAVMLASSICVAIPIVLSNLPSLIEQGHFKNISWFKTIIVCVLLFCSYQAYKMRVSYVESNKARVEAIWKAD